MISYGIEQKENQKIHDEYKLLVHEYYLLKKLSEQIYNEKNENKKDYDDIVFDNDKITNYFFIKYKKERKNLIAKKLNSRNLKEDKLVKLFKVKRKKMKRHTEYLSHDTLGVVLNILSEFYGNIYRDLERSTNKENEFELLLNNLENGFHKYVFKQEKCNINLSKRSVEPVKYNYKIGELESDV